MLLALLACLTTDVEKQLFVGDTKSAVRAATEACQKGEPDELLLKALAADGRIDEALLHLHNLTNPSDAALTSVCWPLMRSGLGASLPLAASSLIASSFSMQNEGADLVLEGLQSSNSALRGLSAQVAASMGDACLRKQLTSMLDTETSAPVISAVIQAVAQLRVHEAAPRLQKMLAESRLDASCQRNCITALAELADECDPKLLQGLVQSESAQSCLLACALAKHFARPELDACILPLCKHSLSAVRFEAVMSLAKSLLLESAALEALSQDSDPKVAMAALWIRVCRKQVSCKALDPFLAEASTQRFACAVLSTCGKDAVESLKELFVATDPYVRLQAAATVLQFESSATAAELILAAIEDSNLRLGQTSGYFAHFTAPAEQEDPSVRLAACRLLAQKGAANTEKALRSFVRQKNWEVSMLALQTLLEDADSQAATALSSLMQDVDGKVAMNAAILLAAWARDEAALDFLANSYKSARREDKLRILETLASVPHKKAKAALTEALQDPSEQLRILSAAALLRCING